MLSRVWNWAAPRKWAIAVIAAAISLIASMWFGPYWIGAVAAAIGIGSVRARSGRARSRPSSPDRRSSGIIDAYVREQAKAGEEARRRAREASAKADAAIARGREEVAEAGAYDRNKREQLRRELDAKLQKGKPFGGALVLLAALSAAAPALAAEPVVSALHEDGRTLPLGWYMDDAEHARTTQYLAELDAMRTAFASEREMGRELANALDETLAANTVCAAALHVTRLDLDASEEEIDRLNAWWRRPSVIVGVSFALGVISTGAVAIAVSR